MMDEHDYYDSYGDSSRRFPNFYLLLWQSWTMTTKLIVINLIVFLLRNLLRLDMLENLGCLLPGAALVYNPWRLVTFQFLHADFTHILFNMYALWLFGRLTEHVLGQKRQLILYLISGIIGGFLWTLCNWGTNYCLVGASASIFGIMTAAALAFPQAKFVLVIPPVPVKLWVLVLVYCGIEILSLHSLDNIGHLAHLGGALGGFIFMRRLGFRLPF